MDSFSLRHEKLHDVGCSTNSNSLERDKSFLERVGAVLTPEYSVLAPTYCVHTQRRMSVSLGSHCTKVWHTENLSDLRHSGRAAIAVLVCQQKPYPLSFSWQRKSYPVKLNN